MADPVPPKKKTKGQQKIEVKMMEDAKRRSVTFTKRRAGLFKKADELCDLTGAEVALMVFSPGGKPYTFSNPELEKVIARYKNQAPPSQLLERQKAELKEIMEQLAYEDKRAEELKETRRQMMSETWMAGPPQTFSRARQQQMAVRMLQLDKILSQPPGFNTLFGFSTPAPDSTFRFPNCSFTSLLTQSPELQGCSGLSSCRPFVAPVTENQNFEANCMVLTPSGNFYTGQSSSAAPARTDQNNMTLNKNNNSFYTCGSSSTVPAVTLNQTLEDNMVLTPPGNFCTGESSTVVPHWIQNHLFEDDMMLNSHDNFYTGESSSMVPAETRNDIPDDDRIATAPGNFYTGESSSMMPALNQNHMVVDNLMLNNNGSFYTCRSSSMASESQIIMFDENMMLAADDDNFFTGEFLTEEPTMNQNVMNIPPHDDDNFNTCGSSVVVPPPADENQVFDESIVVPPHDNDYTFESSLVPTPYDESLFFEENLRLFLDDEFYASSSSMVPPAQNQILDENVMPPCDGYGAGPSGFN